MPRNQKIFLLVSPLIGLAWLLDRGLKFYFIANPQVVWSWPALRSLGEGGTFLKLNFWLNRDLAFGLPWNNFNSLLALHTIIAVTLSLYLLKLIIRRDWQKFPAALCLLLGADANLLDRWLYGGVVDYLNFSFWPIFNLADVLIVAGIFWLAILFLPTNKPTN